MVYCQGDDYAAVSRHCEGKSANATGSDPGPAPKLVPEVGAVVVDVSVQRPRFAFRFVHRLTFRRCACVVTLVVVEDDDPPCECPTTTPIPNAPATTTTARTITPIRRATPCLTVGVGVGISV